jgi:hypothetical protein
MLIIVFAFSPIGLLVIDDAKVEAAKRKTRILNDSLRLYLFVNVCI